ncbi:MAG: hypothetical protein EXR45_06780 [Chloroflexi bacterium]|nr:hypothetical protein [Chloroflexota bacterium]
MKWWARAWHLAVTPWPAERVFRLAGLCMITGGILVGTGAFGHPHDRHPPSPSELVSSSYEAWHVISALGFMSLCVGFPGVTGFQMRVAGHLGSVDVAGTLLLLVGCTLQAATQLADGLVFGAVAAIVPRVFELNGPLFGGTPLAGVATLSGIVFAAGSVSFGLGAVARGALPRRGTAAVMAGGVLLAVPVQPASPVPWWIVVAGSILLGAGSAAIGQWLWQGGPRPSRLLPLPPIRTAQPSSGASS